MLRIAPNAPKGRVTYRENPNAKLRYPKRREVSSLATPKGVETITIAERDLRTLERLRVKRRSDCLAAFSVNEKREIWMYATRGWTKLEQREYVECPAIQRIAEVYLAMRPQGGRVFLRPEGLFDREFGVGSDHKFANVDLPHGG